MESKKYKIIKKKKKKKKDRDVLTSSKVDFQLTHIAMAWNSFFFFFFMILNIMKNSLPNKEYNY